MLITRSARKSRNFFQPSLVAAPMPTTPPSPPGLGCPSACSKWRSYGSYCYYVETVVRRNWDEAQQDCVRRAGRHGSLATIVDGATEFYLMQALQQESTGLYGGFWIGLVRKNDSKTTHMFVYSCQTGLTGPTD